MKFFGAEMEGVTLLENRTADPASYIDSRDRGRLFYNTTEQAVKFAAGGIFKTLDIPTGTVMVFGQSSAPAGWTKKTDWQDNSMMVITNGAISGGGTHDSTNIVSDTESSHTHTLAAHTHTITPETLDVSQIPSHSHSITKSPNLPGFGSSGGYLVSDISGADGDLDGSRTVTGYDKCTMNWSINSTGGGGSHNHGGSTGGGVGSSGSGSAHSHSITPYYRTFIVATKD